MQNCANPALWHAVGQALRWWMPLQGTSFVIIDIVINKL